MPHVDPADLESRGSVSVDLTELHDLALLQLARERIGAVRREKEGE